MTNASPDRRPSVAGSRYPAARFVRALLRKLAKWCLGLDVCALMDLLARTARLEERATLLEKAIEAAGDAPQALWLFAHRQERMDATQPFFDPLRRAFHLARYEFAAGRAAGLCVLDAACGPGYGTRLLREEGKARLVVGLDLDRATARYAVAVHGRDGARFACADAGHLPLPDASMDLVASFETIEHVPDDSALLSEFRRVLRPGGRLICSTPNQWPLAKAPYHVREYDRERFGHILGEFFTVEELYNQNSGGASEFNRGQPAGIVPTTPENEANAECYIAVCVKT